MGENHGLTSHKDRAIIIREDVYERACEGCGRDRMTIIHEVGHTCLHAPENVEFARSFDGPIPAFRSAEWQAKAFAAELIVPHDLLESGMRVSDVAETFGVSSEAASYQLKVYQREGLIKLDGSFDENDPSIVWVKSSV
ncbi:MAG: ImmA/IrrE family metallo-endopeptidase [Pseudomonadota bacterium]